ncbi:19d4ff08-423e-4a13-99ad-d43534fa0e5b [Sclerotinia trifoliorum]|uniref:Carboxylic ester hydrolase n=1 Tax=Sclerotinia trifoliorum TaxID=28548 RepID=A0A8H2W1K3_9HELO|nr:19d4ff08-423e-4a13-99ad-d43534fa0e5b [Sclerotinia trifoliorum]
MRQSMRARAVAALAASTANAASLADVCTVSNVQAALPANGTLNGINPIATSVTANAVYNATSKSSNVAYNYCNVTVTYAHPGKDLVVAWYNFPSPETYKNRFYVGGGGGYALNADPTGGLPYGAVSGVSDAGYAAISGTTVDEVVLTGNGSINWDSVYMFSYQALGEMTQLGKAITPLFYGNNSSKLYTYYEGCSDGGREGMSQIQRYGSEYDGAITGAPAFRYGQQQVNHLFSNVAEVMMDYFPPPCEMDKIVNMTIAACDPLDGRTDGVVSRTDLCKLHFNLNSTIGAAYSCEASSSSSLGFAFGQKAKRQMGMASASTPAQNGTVTAQGAALAAQLYDGMFNSKGERVYLPWQPACSFQDATTSYDNTTGTWGVDIASTGGEFVTKFIQLVDLDNLASLEGVTMDTLQGWMQQAMVRYMDSLQTTVPDISEFQSSGGKLIHYHGESDDSIPTSSSVRYYDSVRSIMYPKQSFNESITSLKAWYKLFLIPGAAHCSTNTLQPGPYPADNMATMIDWVENGIEPERLNATVSSGTYEGEVQKLCAFPLRPIWDSEGALSCEYDQSSVDSWIYTLDAFKIPVY